VSPKLFKRIALALAVVAALAYGWAWLTYPSDRTPEGSYLRVMSAVNQADPHALFPYLETRAQHACFTIGDYRRKAKQRVGKAYPPKKQAAAMVHLEPIASSPEGPDVFELYARENAWLDRLRRDLSRVAHVEINGDRASVQTVKGTRYPFRRRDTGTWGLTLFTAFLSQEAERAARDYAMIEQAAQDYERARLLSGP